MTEIVNFGRGLRLDFVRILDSVDIELSRELVKDCANEEVDSAADPPPLTQDASSAQRSGQRNDALWMMRRVYLLHERRWIDYWH